MSRIVTLLLSVLFLNFAYSQINIQWESRFNGAGSFIDRAVDLELDAAGNTYVTGTSFNGSNYDIVTLKYGPNGGAPIWTSTYAGSGNGIDEAGAMTMDGNGDIIVTGYVFKGGNDYDIVTIKYNGTTGAQTWAVEYADAGSAQFDAGRDVTVDGANNVIVCGVYSWDANDRDPIVIKYNSAGVQQWLYSGGPGSNEDEAKIVVTDASNNIYVAGHTELASGSGYFNFHLLKFNPGSGTPVANVNQDSGFGNLDTPHAMKLDNAGNIIVGGQGYTDSNNEDDYLLMKFDNNLNHQWTEIYAGSAEATDKINALDVDLATNDIYVTGRSKSNASSEDYYTIKYDSNGNEQWSDRFTSSGLGFDEATDIHLSGTGYVYLTGYSYESGSNNDYTTVKYDINGNLEWFTRFNGPSSLSDQALKMRLDASENIFVTGRSHGGAATNLDYSTIKYCQLETIASNDTAICNGQSVDLEITAGGALNPTWVVLSGDAGSLSCSSCLTTTATPNTTTVYIASTESASGCVDEDTVTVVVNAIPTPTIYNDTPLSFCDGESVTLYTDSYASYSWNTTATDSFITVSTGGNYDVTITDANGCQANASTTVTVFALPTVSAGADQMVCPNGTASLLATGADSYLWDFNATLSATNVDNPDATPTVDPTAYYVEGTDANGCKNRDTVVVTWHALPTIDVTADDYTVCIGDSTQLTATGGVSYVWTSNPSLSSLVIPNPYATPPGQTKYYVTGTDANSCQNIDSVTISTISLPGINAGADDTICFGGQTQFFATGALSYAWFTSPFLSDTSVSNPFADPTSTTQFIVWGEDVNGCTNTDTINVVVNALPNVNAGANNSVCIGDSIQLGASGAVSYVWDSDPTFLTATNTPNPWVMPSIETTYQVTGTDANNCENTDVVTISINPLPTIDAGPDVAICVGDSTQFNATGGTSYVWQFDLTLSDFIIPNPWAEPTIDTWYYLQGNDANGCTNYDSVFVTVNPLPAVPVISEDSIWLVSSYAGAGNQWYFNGNPVSGATNDSLDWLAQGQNGTYSLLYTDANGCSSFSSGGNSVTIDNIGIDELPEGFQVQLYPNPTQGILMIDSEEPIEYLVVYGMNGQSVLTRTSMSEGLNEIDLFDLPSGTYLIQMISGDSIVTKRIVKQ